MSNLVSASSAVSSYINAAQSTSSYASSDTSGSFSVMLNEQMQAAQTDIETPTVQNLQVSLSVPVSEGSILQNLEVSAPAQIVQQTTELTQSTQETAATNSAQAAQSLAATNSAQTIQDTAQAVNTAVQTTDATQLAAQSAAQLAADSATAATAAVNALSSITATLADMIPMLLLSSMLGGSSSGMSGMSGMSSMLPMLMMGGFGDSASSSMMSMFGGSMNSYDPYGGIFGGTTASTFDTSSAATQASMMASSALANAYSAQSSAQTTPTMNISSIPAVSAVSDTVANLTDTSSTTSSSSVVDRVSSSITVAASEVPISSEGSTYTPPPSAVDEATLEAIDPDGVGSDVSPGGTITPAITSDVSNRSPELYRAVIEQFAVHENPRYEVNQKGKDDTYCNIYMWDVTKAMGAEIPHHTNKYTGEPSNRSDPDYMSMNANRISDWLNTYGPQYGWHEVSPEQAQYMANQGQPAITIWKNEDGAHGHCQVVSPSTNGAYDPVKGVAVAQAGRTLTDYTYVTNIYNASLPEVQYFAHV